MNGLEWFVAAQEPTLEQARSEPISGQKRSHWMWYIFPQIAGFAHNATLQRLGP